MKSISLREQALQERIMRRVYRVWFVRRVVRNTAKVVILFGLALASRSDIWYAKVFENLRGVELSPAGIWRYATEAFMGTELLVQGVVVVGAILAAAFIWDVGRTIRRAFTIAAARRAERVTA